MNPDAPVTNTRSGWDDTCDSLTTAASYSRDLALLWSSRWRRSSIPLATAGLPARATGLHIVRARTRDDRTLARLVESGGANDRSLLSAVGRHDLRRAGEWRTEERRGFAGNE